MVWEIPVTSRRQARLWRGSRHSGIWALRHTGVRWRRTVAMLVWLSLFFVTNLLLHPSIPLLPYWSLPNILGMARRRVWSASAASNWLMAPLHLRSEWINSVQIKRQRTCGPCEITEIGILWSYDTEIWKSGEEIGSRMCTRLEKSWSTTPALDRWHRRMDWDEDHWRVSK